MRRIPRMDFTKYPTIQGPVWYKHSNDYIFTWWSKQFLAACHFFKFLHRAMTHSAVNKSCSLSMTYLFSTSLIFSSEVQGAKSWQSPHLLACLDLWCWLHKMTKKSFVEPYFSFQITANVRYVKMCYSGLKINKKNYLSRFVIFGILWINFHRNSQRNTGITEN